MAIIISSFKNLINKINNDLGDFWAHPTNPVE